MRELIYAVQLGCVLDLVFKDDATFRALPPKAARARAGGELGAGAVPGPAEMIKIR